MSEVKSDLTEQKMNTVNVKKTKSFSMVWFIPLLALALGAWLVYKNKQDQGVLVTIAFDSGAGIEAGRTKIKYKDVDLGVVENIELDNTLSTVIVWARINKQVGQYLNENTRFWVVKPRVGIGGVSGLNTLLSGSYIGIDSSSDGKPATSFVGLESPPPRSESIPGVSVVLQTDHAGSLNVGSPVYYKQFRVGQIDSIELTGDFSSVRIQAFIETPYDKLINQNSNFWNVSGISAEISANGITVNLQSLESLIQGGIAFDSSLNTSTSGFNSDEFVFLLHEKKEFVGQRTYTEKEFYVLNFDQSIRGLSVGAPVDYRGIRIGQVISIDTQYDEQIDRVVIPVLIEIEPERVGIKPDNSITTPEHELNNFQEFIDQGFRAKLQIGNLLTGQLFVNVDFYPDAEKVQASFLNGYPQLPTLSTDLGEITHNFSEILKKVNKLEIEKIVENVNQAVVELRALIDSTDGKIIAVLNGVDRTLADSRKLMQGLDEDSITRYELNVFFKEIQEAARSVRTLMETIEEKPNSVIFGKSYN